MRQGEGWSSDIDPKMIDLGARMGQVPNPAAAPGNAIAAIAHLTQAISNPPTQAEVQAIQAKINELIAALQLPT